MSEPKPIASLTSVLLARKGAASPAMRRQVMLGGQGSFDPMQPSQDDLGWNDMGDDAVRQSDPMAVAGLTPMANGPVAVPPIGSAPTPIIENTPIAEEAPVPVVVEQRRVLAEKVAAPVEPEVVTDPAPFPASAKEKPVAVAQAQRAKAAFTLRLDPERHLRLRLACAVSNRSAQQIVTQALDAFLDSQPQIDALAEQLPRPSGKKL